MGLESIWTKRWDQLLQFIDQHGTPGLTWSQHLTELHKRQRLALQQSALLRPDLAEMALEEEGPDLKQLLRRSGMEVPIWPAAARAVIERTIGKRSKKGTALDRAQARLRERLEERAAERQAAEEQDRRFAQREHRACARWRQPDIFGRR